MSLRPLPRPVSSIQPGIWAVVTVIIVIVYRIPPDLVVVVLPALATTTALLLGQSGGEGRRVRASRTAAEHSNYTDRR